MYVCMCVSVSVSRFLSPYLTVMPLCGSRSRPITTSVSCHIMPNRHLRYDEASHNLTVSRSTFWPQPVMYTHSGQVRVHTYMQPCMHACMHTGTVFVSHKHSAQTHSLSLAVSFYPSRVLSHTYTYTHANITVNVVGVAWQLHMLKAREALQIYLVVAMSAVACVCLCVCLFVCVCTCVCDIQKRLRHWAEACFFAHVRVHTCIDTCMQCMPPIPVYHTPTQARTHKHTIAGGPLLQLFAVLRPRSRHSHNSTQICPHLRPIRVHVRVPRRHLAGVARCVISTGKISARKSLVAERFLSLASQSR